MEAAELIEEQEGRIRVIEELLVDARGEAAAGLRQSRRDARRIIARLRAEG